MRAAIIASLFLLPSARADDLKPLFEKVLRLEHPAGSLVEQLAHQWEEKCADATTSCFLTEKDYLGNEKGRTGYVLLFRGEADRYSTPGTSPLVREVIIDQHYSSEELLKSLQNQNTTSSSTLLENVVTAHMNSDPILPGDPFVSLTTDPLTAGTFSQLKSKKSGRVLVVSLPKSKIQKPTKNCDDKLPQASTIGNYSSCNTNFIHPEYELDAMFSIHPQDLLDVLIISH